MFVIYRSESIINRWNWCNSERNYPGRIHHSIKPKSKGSNMSSLTACNNGSFTAMSVRVNNHDRLIPIHSYQECSFICKYYIIWLWLVLGLLNQPVAQLIDWGNAKYINNDELKAWTSHVGTYAYFSILAKIAWIFVCDLWFSRQTLPCIFFRHFSLTFREITHAKHRVGVL